MGAAQQLTLKVLKAQCQAQEERFPGYRVELALRLKTILQSVRTPGGLQARDKIAAELQDFGDLLGKKTATADSAAGEKS